MRPFLCLLALVSALAAVPARADDEELRHADLIHAPVPLYTFDWADIWPRSIVDPGPDVIAGCESRVAFGDWRYVPAWSRSERDHEWLRWGNYGVFHCAGNVWRADDRPGLENGAFARGFFVRIGEGRVRGRRYELWALQEGFIPGSNYTLLARPAEEGDGVVERFDVLQRRCPARNRRKARGLDSWLTGYCAIETRDALLAMARRMLREPFLGELRREKEKGPETEAPDPSQSG